MIFSFLVVEILLRVYSMLVKFAVLEDRIPEYGINSGTLWILMIIYVIVNMVLAYMCDCYKKHFRG